MVKDTYTPTWLQNEDFATQNPIKATITGMSRLEQNGKVETVALLLLANNAYRKMSIWGTNKQEFAKKLGDGVTYDTDDAIGAIIEISSTKKNDSYIKTIRIIQHHTLQVKNDAVL